MHHALHDVLLLVYLRLAQDVGDGLEEVAHNDRLRGDGAHAAGGDLLAADDLEEALQVLLTGMARVQIVEK